MKQVSFFFGLGSRYSYIAATQIARLSTTTNCQFVWVPVFSGEIIARSGSNPFRNENRRGQYDPHYRIKDAQRWAKYYEIPFKEPDITGIDWSLVAKACIAAGEFGQLPRFALAVFSEVFGKGNPPGTEQRLTAIAKAIGIAEASFTEACHSDRVAERYTQNVQQAIAKGVFGVPTFVVDDELFWGQDRIPLLVHYLNHRY